MLWFAVDISLVNVVKNKSVCSGYQTTVECVNNQIENKNSTAYLSQSSISNIYSLLVLTSYSFNTLFSYKYRIAYKEIWQYTWDKYWNLTFLYPRQSKMDLWFNDFSRGNVFENIISRRLLLTVFIWLNN